jgi:hypothetical protein
MLRPNCTRPPNSGFLDRECARDAALLLAVDSLVRASASSSMSVASSITDVACGSEQKAGDEWNELSADVTVHERNNHSE